MKIIRFPLSNKDLLFPNHSTGSFSTSLSTYQTALSIMGSGKLHSASLKLSTSSSHGIKITIDDDFNLIKEATGNTSQYLGGNYSNIPGLRDLSSVQFVTPLLFKKSLKIEIKNDGTNTSTARWFVSTE